MAEGSAGKLMTLTEVSKVTGISMPTLQRYKKHYQGRIPAIGSGRKQRYPESSLKAFEEIRVENLGRRGRPKKSAAKPATRDPAVEKRASRRKVKVEKPGKGRGRAAAESKRAAPTAKVAPAAKAAPASKAAPAAQTAAPATPPPAAPSAMAQLLSLAEIGKITGISYPTLLRYVKLHIKDLAHVGQGRRRRFKQEAVEVFKQLRQRSPRGRRKAVAPRRAAAAARPAAGGGDTQLVARIKQVEAAQRDMAKQLKAVLAKLDRPMKITLQRG